VSFAPDGRIVVGEDGLPYAVDFTRRVAVFGNVEAVRALRVQYTWQVMGASCKNIKL